MLYVFGKVPRNMSHGKNLRTPDAFSKKNAADFNAMLPPGVRGEKRPWLFISYLSVTGQQVFADAPDFYGWIGDISDER